MPRIRVALGFAATSRPSPSTISTPSSSDSTSERNASRLRSDARHVDQAARALSAPMNAECTSAHSQGEFGAVVVDDRGRDPLLDQHVGDGRAERDPVLVERQRRDHHEEVEVGLGQPVGDVHEQRRARVSSPTVTTSDCARRPPSLNWASTAQNADRRAVQRGLRRPLVEQQRDDRHRRDVRPQQPQQHAVARLPLAFRQRLAMRQHGTEVPGRVP